MIDTARPGNQSFLRELGAIPTTYGPGLPERIAAALADEGCFRLPVQRASPMVDAAGAHASAEKGPRRGKIALLIQCRHAASNAGSTGAATERSLPRVSGPSSAPTMISAPPMIRKTEAV